MKPDFLPLDLYTTHLKIINGVSFTRREIEVIAFIISGRGVKTIALSLSVAPKTVKTHIHNIMLKLECNSRESIINFIEKSDKLSFIRRHYSDLLTTLSFDKGLAEISRLNAAHKPSCLMVCWKGDEEILPFIHQLEPHLKKVGFKTFVENRDYTQSIEVLISESHPNDAVIYCLPKDFLEPPKQTITCPSNVLFLLPEGLTSQAFPTKISASFVAFSQQNNYYIFVFEILQKLLPHLDLGGIMANFKKEYQNTANSYEQPSSQILEEKEETLVPEENIKIKKENTELFKNSLFLNGIKKPKWLLGGALISLVALSLMGIFYQHSKNPEAQFLGFDIAVPALLNRQELLQQIDKKLAGSGTIHTVALIGMGGAGKTTLARQYAHFQKPSVVWEMNAETKESLAKSFESLAYALSKTAEEKKVLNDLKEMRNFEEREGKIILLLRDLLKAHPNWLLIYDNVEKFSDIQKYFPSDSNSWGVGKIIITTQDTHIQNNSYVKEALWVGELDPSEKLALFMKIMNHGGKTLADGAQQVSTKKFLENLPPFPLDVSVAAYYIKAANIDQDQYLKYLSEYDSNFSEMQKNVLKESNSYTKTRYHIITLSLEKLLAADKDFAALLLLLSLMDSQTIPRDLLDRYKGKLAVDKFIYNLKKYSLIMNPLAPSLSPLSHLSIHRSTQDISLACLTKFLKLNKDSQILKDTTYVLDDYVDQLIEQEDFSQMHLMASHLEKILTHPEVLTDFSRGLLESKLGSIYYFINDANTKKMLENSLNRLEKKSLELLSSEDTTRLARSFLHIGAVYTELRLYTEAQDVFKKAINIYKQSDIKNNADLSWALSHLGEVHRRLSNYEIARDYLDQSLQLNKQYGGNKQRIARTLGYLGSVYRGLGFYKKAIDTLEESLAIYNKNYSNDHFRIGWTLTRLGNVYSDLGDFKKAKQYLENGLLLSKKYFPEDHLSMSLTLTYLGNCYRELGEYEKSRDVLEQSLKIHEKYFDENQRRMGWILFHLGTTYEALGKHQDAQKLYDKVLEIHANYCNEEDIETAGRLRNMAKICLEKNRFDDVENFITRSLKILHSRHHVDTYRSLETLGELYLKKSTYFTENKNNQEIQKLKAQAQDSFAQALKIAEQNFPKQSNHIERIKSKVENIKK